MITRLSQLRLSNTLHRSFSFTGRQSRPLLPARLRLGNTAEIAGLSTTTLRAQQLATIMSTTDQPNQGNDVKPNVEAGKSEQAELPPLSDYEFRAYNRLAERMDLFHNHFRQSWNLLWTACTTGRRPQSMSLKQFISEGLQFAEHLTTHHGIEETYVFPHLAKKMPEFQNGKGGGAAELLQQHRQIHAGLDGFEAYLKACRRGEEDFALDTLKEKMESWGEVLWTHLDQEVKTLGAENMRRYWTMEELRRLPM